MFLEKNCYISCFKENTEFLSFDLDWFEEPCGGFGEKLNWLNLLGNKVGKNN